MPKFRGCAILQTRVIRQKVSLKIIGFSMETPCRSQSEGLQHGSRKPEETELEFTLALSKRLFSMLLENIRIGTSLNILVTQISKT